MALLEASQLTKQFGGLIAVKDLDITIEPGEIIGMIGPNGAGKTTAFNLISGFYKPNNGHILFNGMDITGLRPDQICKKGLARTFQLVKPFPGIKVIDNVMIGALINTNDTHIARTKAKEILEFLEMANLGHQLAGNLPVASAKRLEIAKALATSPKLILLDETMAGLRPVETEEIIRVVRKISDNGIALLLIEHVMRVIMALAQRVIVIHHGIKIAEGEPEEIINNKFVIDAYLGEEKYDVTD